MSRQSEAILRKLRTIQKSDQNEEERSLPTPFEPMRKDEPWRPLISFNGVSLNSSSFCWNSQRLTTTELHQFFRLMKKISDIEFTEIMKADRPVYYFHPISDYFDKRGNLPKLKAHIE